ncbi:hypothetical protein BT93_F1893 [Corymbia citriodora subsp. variegata]|nr:hypothetical protein BT93_F1893 [Corymbia citriodora subsp. variegata]
MTMQRPCEAAGTDSVPCTSRRTEEECVPHAAGASEDCYEEARKTMEELKREIEDAKEELKELNHLKAKAAFSSLWSPAGHHPHHPSGGCSRDPDVVLIAATGGPEGGPSMPLPAHWDILASRSPVFKAMLENEMEESRSGTIKITDMSYDGLRAFVSSLYAEAYLDEQMACELLVLADMYQAKPLKAYCELFLVSKLNWDKSIIYYAFARLYNAKLLLEAALSLISENRKKLREHQEYSILENDPLLGLEIFEACLAKRDST